MTPEMSGSVKIQVDKDSAENLAHALIAIFYSFSYFMLGKLARWVAIGLVVLIGLHFARNLWSIGVDDTDKNAWVRSGFKLYTDYGTGVQYLSDGHGGLIMRQDAMGKPIILTKEMQ
jgi:hypothetical protein